MNAKKIVTISAVSVIATAALISVPIIHRQHKNQAELEAQEALITEIKTEHSRIEDTISEYIPGIVCWGDSLTSGPGGGQMSYPTSLQSYVDENIVSLYDPLNGLSDEDKKLFEGMDLDISIPVVNMGVGGETTNTIMGRNGSVPFVTVSEFTIPADKTSVRISMESANGNKVAPLLQGNAGMESVTIAGVSGVITNTSGYRFTRSEPGEKVTVPAGTEIVTSGSQLYRDYITVVFIGQNGGFWGYDDLVKHQKAIIDHQTRNNDRFVIIGLHTTLSETDREDLEGLMVEEYGDKFINLREYMSTQAIYDAGMTPTAKDLERMEDGLAPYSLLTSDLIHFTSTGYELLGEHVFQKIDELGYFDEVRSAIADTEKE